MHYNALQYHVSHSFLHSHPSTPQCLGCLRLDHLVVPQLPCFRKLAQVIGNLGPKSRPGWQKRVVHKLVVQVFFPTLPNANASVLSLNLDTYVIKGDIGDKNPKQIRHSKYICGIYTYINIPRGRGRVDEDPKTYESCQLVALLKSFGSKSKSATKRPEKTTHDQSRISNRPCRTPAARPETEMQQLQRSVDGQHPAPIDLRCIYIKYHQVILKNHPNWGVDGCQLYHSGGLVLPHPQL